MQSQRSLLHRDDRRPTLPKFITDAIPAPLLLILAMKILKQPPSDVCASAWSSKRVASKVKSEHNRSLISLAPHCRQRQNNRKRVFGGGGQDAMGLSCEGSAGAKGPPDGKSHYPLLLKSRQQNGRLAAGHKTLLGWVALPITGREPCSMAVFSSRSLSICLEDPSVPCPRPIQEPENLKPLSE